MRTQVLALASLATIAGAAALTLIVDAARSGRFHSGESTVWPATLAAIPKWLAWAAQPFVLLGDVHVLLTGFIALFAFLCAKGRWRQAYLTFAVGPGLFLLLVVLRWRIPRTNPLGLAPTFPMTGSFPNETAALGLALAGLLLWVFGGMWARRRGWLLAGLTVTALVVLAPLAIGRAWPSDTLAAATLGVGWTSVLLLGDIFVQELLAAGAARRSSFSHRLDVAWTKVVAWCDLHLVGAWPLATIIALGIVLRLVAPWQWAVGPDADRYAAMGHAFQQTGTFLLPWGDVYTPGAGPQYSHHYPPLFPIVLAGFYELFGFSRDTTRIASIATSLLALGVTYWCTRDLYGHRKGLIATAVVAVSPVLILTTNKAYSENLLIALFVLAMWGIIKSLEKPWFIVAGAIFAALGYLAKSSMGYFFILAGLGGLAWRLRWRGWKVLRDPAYLTGIALFAGTVAAWAYRNYALFGTWQTSTHLAAAYDNAFAHPGEWALLLVFSFLFIFGFGYLAFMAMAPWLPQLARIPRFHREHDSGLWLAVLLPLPLTVVIDAALWLYERDFYLHNVRYVTFVMVPLTWLLMRNVRLSKSTWAAILASFAILMAGSLYYAIPADKLENRVSAQLGPLISDGDSISFVDTNDVYRFYFDATHQGDFGNVTVRHVEGAGAAQVQTAWAVVHGDGAALPAPYELVFEMGSGSEGLRDSYTVWKHAP